MKTKVNKLNLKVVSLALALTATIFYVACVAYGMWFLPNNTLHNQLFSLFIGFEWLTIGSFISGLIQTFIYAWLTGAVFVWIYNWLLEKFE